MRKATWRPFQRARKGIQRLDLSPPDWIVQLASTQDPTIPWKDMLRGLLSVGVPLSLGYATGRLPYGILISIGTLPGMLADRGGPLAARFYRAVMGVLAAAVGLYLGHVLVDTGWAAIVAIAVLSLFAGLVSPVGSTSSFAALQLLVYVAIGSGFVVPMPIHELILFLLLGGVWAILLSMVQALIEGISSPETEAVVAVYCAIADLLQAGTGDSAIEAREQLTMALNNAYDQVMGARSRVHGRDSHLRWLGNMLNAAMALVESSVALAHAAIQTPESEIQAVRQLASAVRAVDRLPIPVPPVVGDHDSLQLLALRRAIRRASRQLRSSPEDSEGGQSWQRRLEGTVQTSIDTVTTRGNWVYALRVTLCMTVAEAVRQHVPVDRPYWILLTVAIVVKPDMGSIFARAIQRGAGTVVGVVVGAILLAVIPTGAPIIITITVLAGFLPLALRRNYALLATCITPLAIMLIDLATNQGSSLVLSRLEATLLGCGIVLVLGYVLWPETWLTRVGVWVSESIELMTRYLESTFSDDDAERTARRRNAYRGLSELRTELQRMLSEPPPFNRRAAAWWTVVNGLERVVDAITESAVSTRQGSHHPVAAEVEGLVYSLHDLQTALGERRAPAPVPEITDPALVGIRDEIAGVARLVVEAPALYSLTPSGST